MQSVNMQTMQEIDNGAQPNCVQTTTEVSTQSEPVDVDTQDTVVENTSTDTSAQEEQQPQENIVTDTVPESSGPVEQSQEDSSSQLVLVNSFLALVLGVYFFA